MWVRGGVEERGSRKVEGEKQVVEEGCKVLGELIYVVATLHRRGGDRQGSGDGYKGEGE